MENGDNGKKEIRTPEQIASDRLKRYQENPDKFTEDSQVVVCVRRSARGQEYLIQGSEQELNLAWCELNRRIMNVLNMIEIQKQEQQNKIIPAKGSMFDFARRRKI